LRGGIFVLEERLWDHMFAKIIIFLGRIFKDTSPKFTFVLSASIKWPDRCAGCNKNPDEYNSLCGRVIREPKGIKLASFHVRFLTKVAISIPVCRHHWVKMETLQILSKLSLIAAWIFLLLFSYNLLIVLNTYKISTWSILYPILISVSFAIYKVSPRLMPVRLKGVGDIFFTIVIKDEDYAKEFSSVNDYKF
jgi:hypothetical protein